MAIMTQLTKHLDEDNGVLVKHKEYKYDCMSLILFVTWWSRIYGHLLLDSISSVEIKL